MNDVSMSEEARPKIGGASISTSSSIIADENGCAGCGIERVCKCDNPDYKTHKLSKELFCINCQSWKCRCLDNDSSTVYEKKIDGKRFYVENEIDGFIYEVMSDDECGEVVGGVGDDECGVN